MKKQFDLEYYLEHPDVKVVTRDGSSARILCTDLDDMNYPIAASYTSSSGHGNVVESFTSKGKVIASAKHSENSADLFFDISDAEKKRVPLTYEDLMERVKAGKTMWVLSDTNTFVKLVIGFNTNFISIVDCMNSQPVVKRFIPEELMIYHFADGTPCWNEVDSCDTCINDKGCVTCNDCDQFEGGEE